MLNATEPGFAWWLAIYSYFDSYRSIIHKGYRRISRIKGPKSIILTFAAHFNTMGDMSIVLDASILLAATQGQPDAHAPYFRHQTPQFPGISARQSNRFNDLARFLRSKIEMRVVARVQ